MLAASTSDLQIAGRQRIREIRGTGKRAVRDVRYRYKADHTGGPGKADKASLLRKQRIPRNKRPKRILVGAAAAYHGRNNEVRAGRWPF